jgi:hypothetical protein
LDKFEILDLSSFQIWKNYLEQLPKEIQDIYYTPEYYQLYDNFENGIAKCFVYKENRKLALYPFLLNQIYNFDKNINEKYFDIQGAYGYNGVLSTNNDKEFVNNFYNEFGNFCLNNNIIAEFTRFHPLLKNQSFSERHLQIDINRKTVAVDLSNSYKEIFNKFQATTRKQIRRAINRYGIEVKHFVNDISEVEIFMDIYFETMNRVKSREFLFFKKEYFLSLFEKVPNVCFIAYFKGKPVSSIIVIHSRDYIHGHLGGTLTDYMHFSPYSLLINEIIKFGIEKEAKFFHMGGGINSYTTDSLLQYKMNFSDTLYDFYIGKNVYNREIYNRVCESWKSKYPHLIDKYDNQLLKYHKIN